MVRIGNRDQLRLPLRRRPHQSKIWIRPAIEVRRLTLKAELRPRNREQPFGRSHRQRPPQQRVHQPKCGNTGTHRQRQRENCCRGSRTVPTQLATAKNHIRPQPIQPSRHADASARFPLSQHRPEDPAHLLRIAPFSNRLFQMRFEFFVQLTVQSISAKDIPEPRPNRHLKPPATPG